jgi:Cu(I)/Ag(I) efflux system membrane fusion protein
MSINRSTIIIIALALIGGFAIGGIVFRGGSTNSHEEHEHVFNEETGEWTCSMHPQVRQSEPGSCPFCGMDLIPVNTSSEESPTLLRMSDEAIALANIQTTIIGENELAGNLVLNGKIKLDERIVKSQTTHFSGRIERLYKNFEGQSVQKGDPIASIYSPELVAAQEEFLEAKRIASSNPVLYEAARKKLRFWKISEEQIKAIEAQNMPLQEIDLLSEYNGVVMHKKVNNGDHLMEGQVLMDIADLSALWVVFDVYEKDIDKIQLGQPVTFTRNGTNTVYEARISFIAPNVNTNRVIEVRANLKNTSRSLKPDMFVKGSLSVSETSALTVPRSSVLWTGTRSIVYIKKKGEFTFELREIELGERLGNDYEVKSGLAAGDEVVTNGVFTIDAEAQLQGKTSMMITPKQIDKVEAPSFVEFELPQAPDYRSTTDPVFQEQLLRLTEAYLELKDAMVEGVAIDITKKTPQVKQALASVDMRLIKGQAHDHWMTLLATMESSIETIQSTSNRDDQRLEFINLSNALINAVRTYGTNNERPLFIQYCPMANEDQGANWISKDENIVNPYFGDMMLTCGSVEEVLKP